MPIWRARVRPGARTVFWGQYRRAAAQNLTQMYTGQTDTEFTKIRNEWNSAADSLNGTLGRVATVVVGATG
ncbi:hypothetical protein [Streptomyces sp. NPDC126503]|uniref:hypothetical protein n=1 Tax=Streptomyces sp. NPDC126503 TaxID=3155315 RepID=UPI003332AD02